MACYRVKPGETERNEEQMRRVYEDLHRTVSAGLRSATFVLEDGVSFVHVAVTASEDGSSPLQAVTAFRAVQERIGDRCDGLPMPTVCARLARTTPGVGRAARDAAATRPSLKRSKPCGSPIITSTMARGASANNARFGRLRSTPQSSRGRARRRTATVARYRPCRFGGDLKHRGQLGRGAGSGRKRCAHTAGNSRRPIRKRERPVVGGPSRESSSQLKPLRRRVTTVLFACGASGMGRQGRRRWPAPMMDERLQPGCGCRRAGCCRNRPGEPSGRGGVQRAG